MKRTKEEFEQAVAASKSIAGVCRFLGLKPAGGNYRIIHKAINDFNLDTSHFTGQGWNVGMAFRPQQEYKFADLLTENSSYQSFKLKKRLLKEGIKKHVCEQCGLTQWNGQPIPLELHHRNGINNDHRLENIQLLCPNCHALTDTYRGLNKSARRETDDVELP